MLKRTMLAILGLLCVQSLTAKTVALWPLDYNPAIGTYDGRCAIDSANDLTVANVTATKTAAEAGWNLPANPDSTPKLFESAFPHVLYTGFDEGRKGFLRNENGPGKYLYMSKDFTLEGWIYLDSLPTDGNLYFIARYGTGGSAAKWLFTLRNKSGAWTGGVSWQINYNSTERLLAKVEGDELTTLVKAWHHFALVHKRSSGQSTCELYIDGVLKGTNGPIDYSPAATGSDNLEIGGRIDSANNINGAMKYVRLSDEALAPEEFLNYGGAGTPVPAPAKVLYWPLGKSAKGCIDGSPICGESYISGGFTGHKDNVTVVSDNLLCAIAPSEDCAFEGNPPNGTVTLPGGNAGSFLGTVKTDRSSLTAQGVGSDLTPLNDFTVEGWAKFERHDVETVNNSHNNHLIGTRYVYNGVTMGWTLQLDMNFSTGKTSMGLIFTDKTGTAFNMNFGDVTDKTGAWHHYALVHDADGGEGGYGRWTCYVDGEVLGTIDTKRAINAETAFAPDLHFFRVSGTDQVYKGKLDCWRVSKAALTADQFLCAESGIAATDVLAFWPMNVVNGVYFDGQDVVGDHHFESAGTRTAYYQAKVTDDTPPQAGIAAGSGSVGFAGYGGDRGFLATTDTEVRNILCQAGNYTAGLTWEVWMKLEKDYTSGNAFAPIWFAANNGGGATSIENGTNMILLTIRADNELFLNAPGLSDKDLGGALVKDRWTHVALVFDGQKTWTLYLDGVKKGSTSSSSVSKSSNNFLYIGGRPNVAGSAFPGKMACMRLTARPLEAGEFLCDQVAPEGKTLAYWPIETDGGELDLESRLPTKWRFAKSGAVAGTDDQAAEECPNPDTSADFIGDPKANAGSAEFGTGAATLRAGSIGEKLDLSAPFTVEGWYKWDNAQGAVQETLVGAWNATKAGGWRVTIDSRGTTPAYRLQVKVPTPGTEFVNVAFDAKPVVAGAWTHVAVEYDPSAGFGTWTLFVNGRKAGTAVNAFRPAAVDLGDWARDLTIGSQSGDDTTAFAGLVDMWRVTSGILDRKELLNYYRKGLLILLGGGEK